MKISILSILFVCLFIHFSWAQNETDALRYANLKPIGTARYSAMGGAFGALGGDLSSITNNPAGIGVYRRSDFSLSTAWSGNNTESNYNQTVLKTGNYNFQLSNIGFVSVLPSMESSHWKFVNFGFAYNQLANYNRDINIRGTNNQNSRIDVETDWLNDNYNASSPYIDANVIFYDTDNNNDSKYYNDYNFNGSYYGADIQNIIRSRGYAGQYDFSLASNFKDFLFVGASFGILHVNYEETKTYSESPFNDSIALKYFETVDYFKTKGNGYNFKLGFIMKLGHLVRLGASFQTPTIFKMNDYYYNDVNSIVNLDVEEHFSTTTGHSNYKWQYSSPLKFAGSGAVVMGRFAVFSAELEMLNYASMSMSASDYSFIDENKTINDVYGWGTNAKAGAEFRVGMLSLRGGFAFFQSPYKSEYTNSDAHTYQISSGIGIKTAGLFFDATYMYRFSKEMYYMYDMPNTAVELKNRSGNFITTIGYRF